MSKADKGEHVLKALLIILSPYAVFLDFTVNATITQICSAYYNTRLCTEAAVQCTRKKRLLCRAISEMFCVRMLS